MSSRSILLGPPVSPTDGDVKIHASVLAVVEREPLRTNLSSRCQYRSSLGRSCDCFWRVVFDDLGLPEVPPELNSSQLFKLHDLWPEFREIFVWDTAVAMCEIQREMDGTMGSEGEPSWRTVRELGVWKYWCGIRGLEP